MIAAVLECPAHDIDEVAYNYFKKMYPINWVRLQWEEFAFGREQESGIPEQFAWALKTQNFAQVP